MTVFASLRRNSSQEAGFTLVEMLIVLAITIILITVGSAYITGNLSNKRVDTSSSRITSLLQTAQEKSIGQEDGARFAVNFDNITSNRAAVTLFEVDEDCLLNCTSFGGNFLPGTIIERFALPADVTMLNPAAGAYLNVIFARGTGLPDASTTISLQITGDTQNASKTVYISGNGRIEYH